MESKARFTAKLFLLLGGAILASVFLPLVISTAKFSLFPTRELIDPTSVSKTKNPTVINALGISTLDYTQPDTWFESPSLPPTSSPTTEAYYTLSIPRLSMFDVPVEIDGTNLKKNSIHYAGTALPGEFGNTVVFGHSSLPYLYKPQNPLTIFNPLTKAEVGDEIQIKYEGVIYKYLVRKTFEVKPSQVEVLSQPENKRELTLITCTPLGTYWRRLIVKADLVN